MIEISERKIPGLMAYYKAQGNGMQYKVARMINSGQILARADDGTLHRVTVEV